MNPFKKMVSIENLFCCWQNYKRGKKKRKDIQCFERFLEENIFGLHEELVTFKYKHGSYGHFRVFDPKERRISRASVRDRLVHHMLYETLYPLFDRKMIFHSFACRENKGVHKGIVYLKKMVREVSKNGICYGLKMDIKKFFDHIDHLILRWLIRKTLMDSEILHLVDHIIDSFVKSTTKFGSIGMPLGNVTSQLFANIYLNELDHFMKHQMKVKFYLRYCDDFLILGNQMKDLLKLVPEIQDFLHQQLHLELHPKKIIFSKLTSGIDFIGYLLFAEHSSVRKKTKIRMKKRLKKGHILYRKGEISAYTMEQKVQSYLGILSHANEYTLSTSIINAYGLRE